LIADIAGLVVVVVVRVRLGHDELDLGHREDREELEEQQEQRQEDAARADEGQDVDPGREEHVPLAGQERPVQAAHDDHEALEPHADGDSQGDDPDHHAGSGASCGLQKTCGLMTLQEIMVQYAHQYGRRRRHAVVEDLDLEACCRRTRR
jgi:hypothetical protein